MPACRAGERVRRAEYNKINTCSRDARVAHFVLYAQKMDDAGDAATSAEILSAVYDVDLKRMIRIREISDPQLKVRIVAKLAEWRGMTPGQVPEWFELDDADFVDLLHAIDEDERGDPDFIDDPRM